MGNSGVTLCPKCGGEQYCPCKHCQARNGPQITWKWVTGNGPIACGNCGHTMDEWDWMIEGQKQYRAEGGE